MLKSLEPTTTTLTWTRKSKYWGDRTEEVAEVYEITYAITETNWGGSWLALVALPDSMSRLPAPFVQPYKTAQDAKAACEEHFLDNYPLLALSLQGEPCTK